MAREKTERVNLTVEKTGVFPVTLDGTTHHRVADVEAEVTVLVTRASFGGSREEPPDPDTSEVVSACVAVTFGDDATGVEGGLTFTGTIGLDAFRQYWYHDELDSEAIEAADNSDDADDQYETQREFQE